jgi:hypothetical protein
MGHEDYSRSEPPKGSSNRAFGLVFAALFLVIALLPVISGRTPRSWSLVVSVAFCVIALAAPRILAPLNHLWTRFGLLLHRIVSPVTLGLMFFVIVTPTGLILRALGKDPLRLKFDRSARSYWVDRQPPGPAPGSLRDQF